MAAGPIAGGVMSGTEVGTLLEAARAGDRGANERLVALLYDELRRMAGAQLRRERPDHTLQPTALVNEVYLRLVGDARQWKDRGHFFAAAAEAMRRVLIEHARQRNAQKRGGGQERVTFDDVVAAAPVGSLDVMDLDEALTALERDDPRLARVVHLRFFVGLSVAETADLLGLSAATIKRDWTFARAWLRTHMEREPD